MKSIRTFMRRSLALLLSLVLALPTSALAADDGDGDKITGEPISIEAGEGTPKTLSDNSSSTIVNYSVTYYQSNARSMLSMVNEFRQSSDAWYWNKDGTKNTVGAQAELTYDYKLEEIAMQRAAEIAIYWSHTRPDGSDLEAMLSEYGYSYNYAGENIAAGYTSVSAAFDGWKEEDEDYDGQGHRRNMLSGNYTAIGIACVKYNGYYYWVQEFSSKVNSDTSTSANDSATEVSAEVASSEVSSSSLSASPSSYSLMVGGSESLPTISGSIMLTETWPGYNACSLTSVDATWSSGSSSIASVSDGKVTGVKSGDTTLTTSALGKSFSVPVSVASIGGTTITLSKTSYTYDGSAKKPSVTVKFGSSTLTKDTDYIVSYSNNTNAGTATVTVTGKGDYDGSQKVNFTINKASQSLSAKAKKTTIVNGKTTTITASGKGDITYKSSNKKIATVNSSGKVTAKGPGKVAITVKAAGNSNYKSASKEITIKVNPKAPSIKSAKNSKSKKATVKWKKVSGVTGYQIQYSTSKSFSSKKSTTVKGASKVSKTLSKLKKGKTYYIRIRSYKTVSGTKYYSAWSSKKSVKIKK